MTTPNNKMEKVSWEQIARRVMLEHGFCRIFHWLSLTNSQRFKQVNGGTAPAIKGLAASALGID